MIRQQTRQRQEALRLIAKAEEYHRRMRALMREFILLGGSSGVMTFCNEAMRYARRHRRAKKIAEVALLRVAKFSGLI